MRRLAQGRTAEVYAYGEDRVLKLYREHMPEAMCRDEFARARVAFDALGDAPEPLETVRVQGRCGIVYERIGGKTMLSEMLARPWHSGRLARRLAEIHVGMRKPVAGELPSVKEKLRADIGNAELLTERERQTLCRSLDALPDGRALCHFDFHPDNVMLSGGGHRIIDWMTACRGDPMADVARTGVMLKFAVIPGVPAPVNWLAGFFKRRLFRQYLAHYTRLTGESPESVAAWEPAVIGARLREGIPMGEKRRLLAHLRHGG